MHIKVGAGIAVAVDDDRMPVFDVVLDVAYRHGERRAGVAVGDDGLFEFREGIGVDAVQIDGGGGIGVAESAFEAWYESEEVGAAAAVRPRHVDRNADVVGQLADGLALHFGGAVRWNKGHRGPVVDAAVHRVLVASAIHAAPPGERCHGCRRPLPVTHELGAGRGNAPADIVVRRVVVVAGQTVVVVVMS